MDPYKTLDVPPDADADTIKRAHRVKAVAEGATINGTYRLPPEPTIEAFRADLLLIVGDR